MKILLTGTIHVGKTTLLNALDSARLPNVVIIPEIARNLLSQNPKLEENPNLQDILFTEQVRREKEAKSDSSVVICDRGSLDVIAHSRFFGHEIKQEWVQWLQTYDLTLLLNKDDVSFSGENRAFVALGRDWGQFRDMLDGHIKSSLNENKIKYELLSGSIEDKLSYVTSRIKEIFLSRESYRRKIEGL